MDPESPRRRDADLEVIDNTTQGPSPRNDSALGVNLLGEACCQSTEEMDGSGRGFAVEATPLLSRDTTHPLAKKVTRGRRQRLSVVSRQEEQNIQRAAGFRQAVV